MRNNSSAPGFRSSSSAADFMTAARSLDLLSLLQLLDNPLQDVPCIAVLRSPLVGLSLDELAEIRLAASGHFWFGVESSPKFKIQNPKRNARENWKISRSVFIAGGNWRNNPRSRNASNNAGGNAL